MNNELKMQILLSLQYNYPIIKEVVGAINKLILVTISGDGYGNVMKSLDFYQRNNIVHPKMGDQELADKLCWPRSSFFVYPYEENAKGKEFMNYLADKIHNNQILGRQIYTPVIVLTNGTSVELDESKYFFISLTEMHGVFSFRKECIVPKEADAALMEYRIRTHVKADGSLLSILQSAACCLPECLQNEAVLENYLQIVEAMALEDEARDSSDMVDEFIFALHEWQRKYGFSNVKDMADLDAETMNNLEAAMLYDHDFLYITEALFKRIAGEMLPNCPINELKRNLANDGTLVCENTDARSVKVWCQIKDEGPKRKRMLRFRRDRLQPMGVPDFVVKCLNAKEENRDET